MHARRSGDYSAPHILGQRDLQATMMPGLASFPQESDADIKHRVTSVDYQAPAITQQRDLDGRLEFGSDRNI